MIERVAFDFTARSHWAVAHRAHCANPIRRDGRSFLLSIAETISFGTRRDHDALSWWSIGEGANMSGPTIALHPPSPRVRLRHMPGKAGPMWCMGIHSCPMFRYG